jgi:hypothetical protein
MTTKMETINQTINTIKKIANNKEFITQHKQRPQDFTRKHELTPTDVIYFVLGKTGNPMDFETHAFCETLNKNIQTPAMCKARAKIKHTAFKEIFQTTAKNIKPKNFYKNYRLTSFDGITGELPRTPELMKKYRPAINAQYPTFHAVAEYDVLNCVYTNAVFAPSPTADERSLVCELLENHDYKGKEIFLFDRGFPSVKLIQMLEKQGKKYVMRVSTSFLREVNAFGKDSSKDKIVHVCCDKYRKLRSRMGFEGDEYCFYLRLVKIDLPKGQVEVLVTNLSVDEFSCLEVGNCTICVGVLRRLFWI